MQSQQEYDAQIKKVKDVNDEVIAEIAQKLAFNYFNSAFKIEEEYPNGYKGNIEIERAECEKLKNDKNTKEDKVFVNKSKLSYLDYKDGEKDNRNWCRNIFIVGAGASYDAYKDIPMGEEAINKLLKELSLFKWYKDDDKEAKKHYLLGYFDKEEAKYYNSTIDKEAEYSTVCLNNDNKFETPKIKHLLFKDKESKDAFLKNILEEINHQLDKNYSFATEPDFEVTLALLSKFFGTNKITSILQRFYSYRYRPSFFYEIIAHLFKHRFIDVIVNFNFDELLDQAIEDELGNGNYHYIISDGDCQNLTQSLFVEKRLRVPIYIKPHGTISHPNLMKFTKEQYIDQSSDMIDLLEKIFEGRIQHERAEKLDNINIFTAGYAFGSAELNKILSKIYSEPDKNVSVYSFNIFHKDTKKESNADEKADEEYKKRIEENAKPKNIKLVKIIEKDTEHGNLDLLIKMVYSEIEGIIKEPFLPKITRHLIIKHLWNYRVLESKNTHESSKILEYFGNQIDRDKKNDKESNNIYFTNYLEDRIYFEILLYLAKNNNRIDIKEALQERLGRYYTEYRMNSDKAKSLRELLEKIGCQLEQFDSISGKCEHKKVKYSLPAYDQCSFKTALPSESFLKDFIENLKEGYNKDIESFNIKHKDNVKYKEIIDKLSIYKEFIKTYFVQLEQELPKIKDLFKQYEGYTFDISTKYDDRRLYRFETYSKRSIYPTFLNFKYDLFEQLESKEWNLLLVTIDTGVIIRNFLTKYKNDKNALRDKKIILVTASSISSEEEKGIKEDLKQYLSECAYYTLPYFVHNEHMFLFFKENELAEDMECVKSIYYEKNSVSNQINPIALDIKQLKTKDEIEGINDEKKRRIEERMYYRKLNDLNLLLSTFDAYLKNSTPVNLCESKFKNGDSQMQSQILNEKLDTKILYNYWKMYENK